MMPKYIGAESDELWYIASVAVPTAPTAAELNAGVRLTGYLPGGSFAVPLDGSIVDAADQSSKYNKTAPGTYGGQPATVDFFGDSVRASDTAYTTHPRGTTGYWASSPRPLATPGVWAVGDAVDLSPISVVSRNRPPKPRNEPVKFTVMAAIPGEPLEDYVIAS